MPVVDRSGPVTSTSEQQAVPVAQEAWRINPETPTVILTPHGRIAINWSVQQAGGEVTYDLAEQTAEMIVRAVNSLPCKSGEGAGEGWIVGSADGKRFRTWMDGWSEWTGVREAATRYARRQDAEAVHMHDEDAWTVMPYAPDATQTREAELVAVAEYNEVYDKFEEVVGGAFREGFREGWVFAQTPDGTDYDDRQEEYGRTVDIEPSEAWEGYRDKYAAMLPVAALPTLNREGSGE